MIDVDREGPEAAVEGDLAATYQNFYNKVRSERDAIQTGYEEARKHIANGNFVAAGTICDSILAQYPNHALFQAMRFDVGEGLRQSLSADMARVDQEVEAEPDLDRRVKILEEAVARHPAEAHFKHALQGVSSKRDLVNSIAAKARGLEESGHFQEAISQWDILRNIYPQFPGVDFEVERLKKRREQQSRLNAKALWAERIDGALNSGDHARALELVASALAEFPSDPELTALEKQARQGRDRGREGQELIEQGQELRKAGKLSEAVAVLRKAVGLDERNPAARAALVEALVAQAGSEIERDWNAADVWLDQAISFDAGHTQARSLKTLVGDKRREAGVNEALAQARELQGAGNIKGAYQEVLSGLAAFPLDNRLTQLKNQLSKTLEEIEKAAPPKAPPPLPPTPPAAKQAQGKSAGKRPPAPPPPAATAPPSPTPPPRVAVSTAAPAVGSKPPLWIAAVAIPVLAALGWLAFLRSPATPPPPPPPPTETRVAFEVNVTPPAARLRIGDKDFGTDRRLELAEGDYQLEVYGEGIKPQRIPIKVSKGMAALAPIQAEVEPPALVLALSGAQATLDKKLVTVGGRLPIEPGDHRLEFFQGQGRGVVEFNIAPGVAPTVKSAAGQGMFLTAVAVLGKSAKVFGARKGGLGAQDLVDVPPTGLDLTGLTEQPQPMRVSDGAEIRTYDLTSAVAPTVAIFVADPGRVDLTVLSNEEGAIVQINGKQSGVVQKGQRLEQLPPGIYKVRVSKPGFIELPERTVTLAKGRGAREQFELKAAMASVRIVGSNTRAQVSIDGKALGEIKPGEPFVANVEPGRHRVSVKAEHHQTTDREVDFKVGSETALAWRELAVAVGYVQLVSGANLGVSYSSAGTPPKAAVPGRLELPVGDYTFKAIAPGGGAEQTQAASVRVGQTVPINFAPPSRTLQIADPAKQPGAPPAGSTAPSLFGKEWKDGDDGWMKLDGGKQAIIPGSTGTISFQIRRKGGILSFAGGRPGWLYIMPAGFVRFELGNDKLMWWVRDKKVGEAAVPKEVEDVRIEIAADAITHTIGSATARIPAAELGFPSFAGGQFRFKGPISIKGLSPRLR